QASQLEPSDYQVHYQLYQALVRNHKDQEARALQARLKQIEDDLSRLQKLMTVEIQQQPHNPDLQYEAGMIAMRAGAIPDGLHWFESALREDPNHAPTHRALAQYYQKMGELGRAAHHRDLARQAAP